MILFFNIFIHNIGKKYGKDNVKINPGEIISEKNHEEELKKNTESKQEQKTEDSNWYVEIPIISLKAPIQESVNMDVLNKYVGHFEETSKTQGNIGLAGHNRGYSKNYFQDLNKLRKGDEIKYKYKTFENTYLIQSIEIIKSTNWSYIENTKENKITLITCIENKPDFRLCVQAVQK